MRTRNILGYQRVTHWKLHPFKFLLFLIKLKFTTQVVELVDHELSKGNEKLKGKSLAARRGTQNGTKDAVKKQK